MLREIVLPILMMFAVIVMIGEAYTKEKNKVEELEKKLEEQALSSDR